MFDVVCFGGATQDNFIKIAQSEVKYKNDPETKKEFLCFEHHAKINVEDAMSFTGGGAMNTSIAFAKLGFKPVLVTAIGKDSFGENILNQLALNGISDMYVVRVQGVHTAFSTILTTQKGDRTVFVYRGASDHLEQKALPNFKQFGKARWLVMSNLSGTSSGIIPEVFGLKKLHPEIRIAWNPGKKQLEKGIESIADRLKRTTIFIVNREEAELLVNIKPQKKDDNEAKNLLRLIAKRGPEVVVITDASKGSFAYSNGQFYKANILSEEIANTTGAGDSFFAGFIRGYDLSKGDVDVALGFGSSNAAGCVSKFGAQNGLLTVDEINKKMRTAHEFKILHESLPL